MPLVESGSAEVYWAAQGSGQPVLLLMGLGCSSALWFRVAPSLARSHRVIVLDNRGVGRTKSRFTMAHRVRDMAADAVAVLDAAGESSAHVVGFSMGGMIGQQLAVDHPARVRSLALLGTHSGGPWAVQASADVRRLLFTKDRMSHEAGLRAMRRYTYARETPDELFDEDVKTRLANPPPNGGYMAQLNGLIGWSAYFELPRIAHATLIMHGLQDELILPANGRILAERIPNSTLVELDMASHWLMTDQTDTVLAALDDHIKANSLS